MLFEYENNGLGIWYSSIVHEYKQIVSAKVNVDFCVDIERRPRALHGPRYIITGNNVSHKIGLRVVNHMINIRCCSVLDF